MARENENRIRRELAEEQLRALIRRDERKRALQGRLGVKTGAWVFWLLVILEGAFFWGVAALARVALFLLTALKGAALFVAGEPPVDSADSAAAARGGGRRAGQQASGVEPRE